MKKALAAVKRKAPSDFEKKKSKLGKKKAKADNFTNTEIKTKTISMPNQSVMEEKGEMVNTRNLNIRDLLVQMKHFSTNTRKGAVLGLKDLIQKHPRVLELHLSSILDRLSPMLLDLEKAVRKSVISVLGFIFPLVPPHAISGLLPILVVYACSGLTHLMTDIRADSLSILLLLLEKYPSQMTSQSGQVIFNLVRLLSSKNKTTELFAFSTFDAPSGATSSSSSSSSAAPASSSSSSDKNSEKPLDEGRKSKLSVLQMLKSFVAVVVGAPDSSVTPQNSSNSSAGSASASDAQAMPSKQSNEDISSAGIHSREGSSGAHFVYSGCEPLSSLSSSSFAMSPHAHQTSIFPMRGYFDDSIIKSNLFMSSASLLPLDSNSKGSDEFMAQTQEEKEEEESESASVSLITSASEAANVNQIRYARYSLQSISDLEQFLQEITPSLIEVWLECSPLDIADLTRLPLMDLVLDIFRLLLDRLEVLYERKRTLLKDGAGGAGGLQDHDGSSSSSKFRPFERIPALKAAERHLVSVFPIPWPPVVGVSPSLQQHALNSTLETNCRLLTVLSHHFSFSKEEMDHFNLVQGEAAEGQDDAEVEEEEEEEPEVDIVIEKQREVRMTYNIRQLMSKSSSGSSNSAPAAAEFVARSWSFTAVQWLKSATSGRFADQPSLSTSALFPSLLPILRRMLVTVPAAQRKQLWTTMTRVYESFSASSANKRTCISFFARSMIAGTATACSAAAAVSLPPQDTIMRWLSSLPRLLWELQDSSLESSEFILDMLHVMARRASTGSKLQTQFDALQAAFVPFFFTEFVTVVKGNSKTRRLFGPFSKLPSHLQSRTLELLYYFSSLSDDLLKSLAICFKEQPSTKIGTDIITYALEIVHSRHSQIATVDRSAHISFILTSAIGQAAHISSSASPAAPVAVSSILTTQLRHRLNTLTQCAARHLFTLSELSTSAAAIVLKPFLTQQLMLALRKHEESPSSSAAHLFALLSFFSQAMHTASSLQCASPSSSSSIFWSDSESTDLCLLTARALLTYTLSTLSTQKDAESLESFDLTLCLSLLQTDVVLLNSLLRLLISSISQGSTTACTLLVRHLVPSASLRFCMQSSISSLRECSQAWQDAIAAGRLVETASFTRFQSDLAVLFSAQ